MKYHLDWLIEESEKENRIKYLFFWGHQPNKDGSVSKSCFSQWWLAEFEKDNIKYKSAEHWMMAGKARLFEDNEMLEKIILSKSPAEAKKLGRQVKNYDETTWQAHRYEIVKEGNLLKFGQHPDLKEFLVNTQERVLVEASPYDNIWGIGMIASNPESEHPSQWNGLNLLGFALMEVRDELRA